jgi:hypothetical protein
MTMTAGPRPTIQRAPTPLELATLQLAAIERWTAARAARTADLQRRNGRSREQQMDADRQLRVLDAVHSALVAVLDEHLKRTGGALLAHGTARLVTLNRNDWFAGKLAAAAAELGITTLARPTSGAAAFGAMIAEQPELIVIEDTTTMIPALEIIEEVRAFSPHTHVVLQVGDGSRTGDFLDAGVSAVVHRCLLPGDVAAKLAELVAPR